MGLHAAQAFGCHRLWRLMMTIMLFVHTPESHTYISFTHLPNIHLSYVPLLPYNSPLSHSVAW